MLGQRPRRWPAMKSLVHFSDTYTYCNVRQGEVLVPQSALSAPSEEMWYSTSFSPEKKAI